MTTSNKEICIYAGSFNPIHNGHISLAEYIINNKIADEVWMVVSPHNPLKIKEELLDDNLRLKIAELAFEDYSKIKVSDVEFRLPRPSYMIDTLNFLKGNNPIFNFTLLIGEDNVPTFNKWKNYKEILENFRVLVYPRKYTTSNSAANLYPNMRMIEAPTIDISSTEIRSLIQKKLPTEQYLPRKVDDFIKQNGLYLI